MYPGSYPGALKSGQDVSFGKASGPLDSLLVKALTAKPDDLSSSHRAHMVEENQPTQAVLSPYPPTVAHTHTQMLKKRKTGDASSNGVSPRTVRAECLRQRGHGSPGSLGSSGATEDSQVTSLHEQSWLQRAIRQEAGDGGTRCTGWPWWPGHTGSCFLRARAPCQHQVLRPAPRENTDPVDLSL